ncbi:CPCC family cysteine-rich protein [Calidithermus terrae]|uniref:CPCC family cysteine-rich protein n=1 Tax=Calidithermus terrae TaxID=1408545 RepID=UPI000E64FBCA
MMEEVMFACPCCSYLTLSSAPPGTFEICPVCYWEDDNVQFNDPDYAGGANAVSLNEARANFKNFGAISREFITRTRPPKLEEFPPV